MRACCCGLDALNETVSPAVMQPASVAQVAAVMKIRMLKSPRRKGVCKRNLRARAIATSLNL